MLFIQQILVKTLLSARTCKTVSEQNAHKFLPSRSTQSNGWERKWTWWIGKNIRNIWLWYVISRFFFKAWRGIGNGGRWDEVVRRLGKQRLREKVTFDKRLREAWGVRAAGIQGQCRERKSGQCQKQEQVLPARNSKKGRGLGQIYGEKKKWNVISES